MRFQAECCMLVLNFCNDQKIVSTSQYQYQINKTTFPMMYVRETDIPFRWTVPRPQKDVVCPLIKGLAIISTQWPCVPILHPLAIKIPNSHTTPPPSTTTYYPIPTIKRIFQHPLPFTVHHATLLPIPTTTHDQAGQWPPTICQPSVTAPPLTTENLPSLTRLPYKLLTSQDHDHPPLQLTENSLWRSGHGGDGFHDR